MQVNNTNASFLKRNTIDKYVTTGIPTNIKCFSLYTPNMVAALTNYGQVQFQYVISTSVWHSKILNEKALSKTETYVTSNILHVITYTTTY